MYASRRKPAAIKKPLGIVPQGLCFRKFKIAGRRRLRAVMIFSRPDCTVGAGISPVQSRPAGAGLAGFTAGGELPETWRSAGSPRPENLNSKLSAGPEKSQAAGGLTFLPQIAV
jgi:hypothetical protein